MTKFTGWAAFAALIAYPSFASAQDYGMDRAAGPTGGFELEYIGTENRTRSYFGGNIDLMQRGLSAGAVTLGFDLGVDATFDLSKGDDRYAFFGAIVVDPGFGEIAVGAPRSIGSVLIDRPVFAGNQARDRDLETVFPPMSDSLATSGPSTVRLAKKMSRASSMDGCATKAPRFGTRVTSPSRPKAARAFRMRARLTEKISASSSSFRRVPGRSFRSAIDSQSRL